MTVKNETILRPERFEAAPAAGGWVERAFCDALQVIDRNLPRFAVKFPAPASVHQVYPALDNIEWTSSFWTGMLWLAYELTGAETYRRAAEGQLESYYRRVAERSHTDTHDLGFLYSLSCVAAYKLTKNQAAKQSALAAAELLAGRFFPKAGIIQAWGDLNDPAQRGRMIIDCLMNLPLLYWAAGQTGDNRDHELAHTHAKQAARYIVREDASTFHTYYMDVETGAPLAGDTHQGYSDGSCWARGQAWGIYGFTLSYRYTGDRIFLELARRLAHYFLNRLPADGVPYWDLIFTDGPEERDSSAAAIAVCGLLELAGLLPLEDSGRELYRKAALTILASLATDYTAADDPAVDGLLLHAVYHKSSGKGVDECCIWGDYFYLEALARLRKDWTRYW
jgi:unsaturated chondroitin disaccharide hydrolase